LRKGTLAILDYEIDYANNLMDYLNRKNSFLFETRVFTNMESLLKCAQNNMIDILIISEDIGDEHIEEDNIKNILILTEHNQLEDKSSIYKYQSMENIVREILSYYVSLEESRLQLSCKSVNCHNKIIGVFSPAGGNYQTTFSLALGQALAKDKMVLYMNFEVIPGSYIFKEEVNQAGLSDLIYYIKQRKPNISLKIKAMVQKLGRLDYLPPVDFYMDLFEMNIEDIQILMDEITKNSDYEVVIIDMGFVGKNTIDILKKCRTVYMPTSNSKIVKSKEEKFLKMLLNEKADEFAQGLILVEVPTDEAIARNEYQMDHLCVGELGNYINELIEQL
jgi:hypothetical protein